MIVRTIKQHPVAAFILLTTTLSIAMTAVPLEDNEMKFATLSVLLVSVALITALVVGAALDGWRGVRELFYSRRSLGWFGAGLALGFLSRFGNSVIALAAGTIPAIIMNTPPVFMLLMPLFALFEEVGWRNFALRRLAQRMPPITAMLITVIPWSIIHVFLFAALGETPTVLTQVFGITFLLGVMISWVYLRGGNHLLAVIALHGAQNFFVELNRNIPPDLVNGYALMTYGLIAGLMLLLDWRMWLAHQTAREAQFALQTR